MIKYWIPLLIIAFFSLLGMKALFHPGLFTAHDISHQVVRFYYYLQAVNDGQLPPYWVGQLARRFGYPLFIFSFPLPWILGILLIKIGISLSDALKALFFLSFISSGITMYFFTYILLRNKLSALLSSILYLWLPYHFLITFVSASLGIAFVFVFLPLLLLGVHLIGIGSRFGIPILSLSFSGIILSHIMHLVFLSPVIVIFTIWEFVSIKKKINFVKNLWFGLILAILISSFYLIPATYYSQFTKIHQESGFSELYKRNFINLNQLIYSKWGFGPIINNAKNSEISFQLGIAQWISILSLALLFIFKRVHRTYQLISLSMLFAFVITAALMLDISKPIWELMVKLVIVDFPFRFILPASFIASICAGIALINMNKKLQISSFIFLIFIAIYTNRNHINVNLYTNLPISTYLDLETEVTTNTFNEYFPIGANSRLLNKPWNEVRGENLIAANTRQTTDTLLFDLIATKQATASAGQFYFPGQTLYLDNKSNKFKVDEYGRIEFTIPTGEHTVMIKYQQTPLIKFSKILTIVGFLLTLFLFLEIGSLRKKLAPK